MWFLVFAFLLDYHCVLALSSLYVCCHLCLRPGLTITLYVLTLTSINVYMHYYPCVRSGLVMSSIKSFCVTTLISVDFSTSAAKILDNWSYTHQREEMVMVYNSNSATNWACCASVCVLSPSVPVWCCLIRRERSGSTRWCWCETATRWQETRVIGQPYKRYLHSPSNPAFHNSAEHTDFNSMGRSRRTKGETPT